jgi:aspartate/methionine/tyrosine aminotransferase
MNPAIAAAGGSTIRALHARRRPTSINLGIGEPSLLPDVRHFEAATRWIGEHGCRYSTNIGDEDLRAALAARYAYPGLDLADNVCITTGSQEAVYVTMRAVLDPARDEVLLVEPAFPVYAKIAQVEGIPLRRVAMSAADDFRFDADRILEAIGPKTRMLVLCSPCNPTGRVIDTAAVKKISSALASRGGPPIYIMHDEIYRELVYADDVGEFGKHYPYTIAINSLSKSNALTGLRLGWVIAPPEATKELVKVHGWTTSCASTFAQRVAFEIVRAGELGIQREWYARQREGVLEAARAAGLRFVEPEGAFYLCVEVGGSEGLAFCHRLIDEYDVVAVPGGIFASTLEGWLRTSFVGPLEGIREGLRRIAAAAPVFTRT